MTLLFKRFWLKGLFFFMLGLSILGAAGSVRCAESITLNGGGASFPAPLYVKWFKDYHRLHPEVRINYQALGSTAGVFNFVEKRFDFAGSDVPMTDEESARVDGGVVQTPLTGGGVTFIYNLGRIKNLRLSREAYTGIFLGEITHWRDPKITRTNPGVELPNREIIVVARMGGSGTAYVLTRHLSAVSKKFAETVGATKTPVWPQAIAKSGRIVKAPGNGELSQMVRVIPGAIGFVEYCYAFFTDIPMATIENKAGKFIAPEPETFSAAFDSLARSAIHVPDPEGDNAYPMVSLTWLLFNETYNDPKKLQAVKGMLHYCLTDGQSENVKLGYIPLSEPLLQTARKMVDAIRLQ